MTDASQNGAELPHASDSSGAAPVSRLTLRQRKRQFSLLVLLGGRAYSALPCAGAPPPQRPLSYNMPRRPRVYVRNGCPVERVSPNHGPPVLRIPRRCRPCACPLPSPFSGPPPVRPGLAAALHLSTSRQTISATAGTILTPDFLHPKSRMHPSETCPVPNSRLSWTVSGQGTPRSCPNRRRPEPVDSSAYGSRRSRAPPPHTCGIRTPFRVS